MALAGLPVFGQNVGDSEIFDDHLTFVFSREELQDFHVSSYAGGDFGFDTFGVKAPQSRDQHRWFAFPEMSDQEVLTLRTYDSERAALRKPFWTPHSAFRDPNVSAGNPARKSIEVRATCVFE